MRTTKILAAFVVSSVAFAAACSTETLTSPTPVPLTDEKIDVPGNEPRADGGTDSSKKDPETKDDEDGGEKCGGFGFSDSACGKCAESSCCAAAATCMADKECAALVTCTASCTDNNCLADCAIDHSTGISKFTAINTCAESKCASSCAPKATKGIGDPCSSSSECKQGTCNAASGGKGWCTASCNYNTDCAGYPQINNQSGKFNYCLSTAAGSRSCFPGCSTNSDCTKYGSGVTCQSAGSGVNVCSL